MAGNFKIGAGLALDGEKEFKRAISEINKDMSVLSSEMKKVTAQYDGNANSIEALTAKQNVYNKQAEEQRKKVELLQQALESAKKEYGENSAKVKEWQIKLNNAEADLAKTENTIRKTADEIDNFGKESEDSGKEIEKAGKQAKESGEDAEKGESGWSKLGGALSKVGELAGKAVAALGAAATAAGSALVAASVSGAQYADELLTLAVQTGLTTEQLQEFKYMQELVDVPLETMTKSLAKNVKSMSDAANGSKNAAAAYEKLGINITNSDGSLRDANDVFFEAIEALGNISNETERDAIAMQLFGKSARELNPLIKAGADGLKELRKQAHEAGYVLSDEALDAFGAFDDQLQYLKVNAEGAKNALGTILLPVLTELAGEGADLLSQFTASIQGANGDIGQMAQVVADMIPQIVDKIMELLPTLIDLGLDIISALGKGLLDNLPIIIDSAIRIVSALITGLIDALPMIIDGALELLKSLVNTLLENLPMIVKAGLELIVALALGIADSLPELIPTIVDAVLLIVETLIDNVDMLIDAAIAIIMALAEGLINALPRLIEKAPEIISKLMDAIIRNAPKLLAAAGELITMLVKGIANNLSNLGKTAAEIVKTIISGIKNLASNLWEVGKDVVRGIWEGIKSMSDWLWKQVKGFFSGIVDGVKSFLGIQSPSKVFAGIGEFMAEGLGEGFTREMQDVQRKINDSVPTEFDVNARTGASQVVEGLVNGLAPVLSTPPSQPIVVQIMLNGRMLAQEMVNPLREVLRQRGEALA